MTKKIVAISGKNGFIGRHLAYLLEARGYSTVGVDRDLLTDPDKLRTFLKSNKVTHVIHLAAYGNHFMQQDDDEIFLSNVVKTYNMLTACKTLPLKAFVNCSSSSVYGKKYKAMKEDDCLETDTMYGASKVCGEYYTKAFSKKYNMNAFSVRPFSVFGDDEADFRLIPTAIRSVRDGEKMALDPNPSHDWILVDDFCEGLIVAMENADKLKGQAINIGSGIQHTNEEVISKIEWLYNSKANVEIVKNQRVFDTSCWVADISKILALGWYPKYTMMQGLKTFITVKVRELCRK